MSFQTPITIAEAKINGTDSIDFAVDQLRQNEEDAPWLIPSDFSIRA